MSKNVPLIGEDCEPLSHEFKLRSLGLKAVMRARETFEVESIALHFKNEG